jgi:selenium metabolism protein YedF
VKTVFVVNGDTLGTGDDVLGSALMGKMLITLADLPEKPAVMVFYNSGVRLLCEGSPALPSLKSLEAAGVELWACGTCLDYYELRSRMLAGRGSNMREIAGALFTADKVVTI